MVLDSPVGLRKKVVVLYKFLSAIINKEKCVYVTYDPLYEKVICTHDKPNMVCDICKKLSKRRSTYHLTESKHIIQNKKL